MQFTSLDLITFYVSSAPTRGWRRTITWLTAQISSILFYSARLLFITQRLCSIDLINHLKNRVQEQNKGDIPSSSTSPQLTTHLNSWTLECGPECQVECLGNQLSLPSWCAKDSKNISNSHGGCSLIHPIDCVACKFVIYLLCDLFADTRCDCSSINIVGGGGGF